MSQLQIFIFFVAYGSYKTKFCNISLNIKIIEGESQLSLANEQYFFHKHL